MECYHPIAVFLRLLIGREIEFYLRLGCIAQNRAGQNRMIRHKARQVHRQHVPFFGESAKHEFCRIMPQKIVFCIVHEIAGSQHLMTGATFSNLPQLFCRGFHRVLGKTPQGNVDLHGIFRLQAFLPELRLL